MGICFLVIVTKSSLHENGKKNKQTKKAKQYLSAIMTSFQLLGKLKGSPGLPGQEIILS